MDDIIAKQKSGARRRKPQALPPAQGEENIEPGAERDNPQAWRQRQRKFEQEMHAQNRNGLPDHRQPAQSHQGAKAQEAGVLVEAFRCFQRRIEHRHYLAGPKIYTVTGLS